jgi:hypothetical protein
MLYESALVGAFNYLWGHRDARAGKPPSMAILSNAQNPLDHLLGDMLGVVDGRYFLIEFKATSSGFHDEVHATNAKPARRSLYQHLRNDSECRTFARFGHFGAWSDGDLRFAPYAHVVGPGRFSNNQWHELDYASFEADFNKFYADINCQDLTLFEQDRSLYAHGLGIPADAMLSYLECILQQFSGVIAPKAEANAIFGIWCPANGSVKIVPTSMEGLLWSLEEMRRLTQKSTPTPPANASHT